VKEANPMKPTLDTSATKATPVFPPSTSKQLTEARLFRVALHVTNSDFSIERRATVIRLARGVLSEPKYKALKKMVWSITNDQLRIRGERN
jgi:hypothetical protein